MSLEQEPDPLRRIPTKHTTSLRAEIGPILRAARLKRGQSLEAVAQQTRISKRFLEALENDRFEQFPAVVYLRGFLKGYCEHLDVNFDEIWAKLNEAQSAEAEAAAPADGAAHAPQAKPAAHKKAPAAHHAPAPHAPAAQHAPQHAHDVPAAAHAAGHGASGAAPAIVLAAALGLGLAVWLLKDKGPAAPEPAAPAAFQPVARAVEPKLTIRLKEDAWIRVALDGQVVYEGRAPRDTAQDWKPQKFVDLRTTEPSAIELSLNGLPVALGAPGPEGQYRVDIP